MPIQPLEEPLSLKDLTDAMLMAGVGVQKTTNIGANVGMRAPLALVTQLNHIIKAKEAK